MVIINQKLYIFGGIYSTTLYNDLWTFDILKSDWEIVLSNGEIPSPRYLHAADSDGDTFAIWGGQDTNGLTDSLYIFNSIKGSWTLLSPTSSKPSPAKGSCLVMSNYEIFIYGGFINSGYSNELWKYNLGSNQYEKISSSGLIKTSYSYCFISSDSFYVSLGSTNVEQPSTSIFYYNFSTSLWDTFHFHNLTIHDSSQSNQVFIDGKLISIGGQSWMIEYSNKIIIYEQGSNFIVLDEQINFTTFASGFIYFNKSVFVFGGGSLAGGYVLPYRGHNVLAEIKIDEICKGSKCKALCSKGTSVSGEICKVCPKGTYSDELGKDFCVGCKAGTYNSDVASSSEKECLPCPEGWYSNFSAMDSCIRCPQNKSCPIGSITPSDNYFEQKSDSIQPSLYNQAVLTEHLLIYRLLSTIPIFLLIIIFLSFKSLRQRLVYFDLFTEKHSNNENNYLIKKKTIIGACFSLLFIIGTLLLTCSTVLDYFFSNIQETKALIPLVVLESEVSSFNSSRIILEVSLNSYGGECAEVSKCLNLISISTPNLFCSSLSTTCTLSTQETCSIKLICENGQIKTGEVLTLNLKETSSYTSGIQINLTSSSSIPDQISSVTSSIASSTGSVFRGSVPSEFYFLATPSLFKSESNKWTSEETGFHISEKKSPQFGSQVLPEDLPAVSYLNIKVFVDISSTALLTVRLMKQDFVFFAGALLGSASGIFGIAGFVMAFLEQVLDKIKNRNKAEAEAGAGAGVGVSDRRETYVVNRTSNSIDVSKIGYFG